MQTVDQMLQAVILSVWQYVPEWLHFSSSASRVSGTSTCRRDVIMSNVHWESTSIDLLREVEEKLHNLV